MSDQITYKTILDRCKADVLDYLPNLPKENTLESWESYLESLETWRDESIYEQACESVDSWDWSAYTHYGWKILDALPQDRINDAEESFLVCNHGIEVQDLCGGAFDIYSLQSQIAHFALLNIWQEVAQECVDDLIDLAQASIDAFDAAHLPNQIDNLES